MSEDDFITKREIAHAGVGGVICLFAMFIASGLIDIGLERLLVYLGILGVTLFEPYVIAKAAIVFATVYLVGGFLGGLYTGYATEKGLKITLLITGGIGYIGFLLLLLLFGGLNLSHINYLERVVLPLLGNVIGAYLGGYTTGMPSEEPEEEEGKIRLEL